LPLSLSVKDFSLRKARTTRKYKTLSFLFSCLSYYYASKILWRAQILPHHLRRVRKAALHFLFAIFAIFGLFVVKSLLIFWLRLCRAGSFVFFVRFVFFRPPSPLP